MPGKTESQKRFRPNAKMIESLLLSSGEGIYGVDLKGDCTFCNPKCIEILGYSDETELIGKNMHSLIHHTKRDGSKYDVKDCKIYSAHIMGKGVYVDDEIFWTKDGESFHVEYRSFPIKSGKEITGSVINFSDISKRRALEERVKDKTSELHKKNIALTEILGQLEIEKIQINKAVSTNINKLLLPLTKKLSQKAPRTQKNI